MNTVTSISGSIVSDSCSDRGGGVLIFLMGKSRDFVLFGGGPTALGGMGSISSGSFGLRGLNTLSIGGFFEDMPRFNGDNEKDSDPSEERLKYGLSSLKCVGERTESSEAFSVDKGD